MLILQHLAERLGDEIQGVAAIGIVKGEPFVPTPELESVYDRAAPEALPLRRRVEPAPYDVEKNLAGIRRRLQVDIAFLAGAIQAVANNRVTEIRQVAANLVLAARLDPNLDERLRLVIIEFQELHFADRTLFIDGFVDSID